MRIVIDEAAAPSGVAAPKTRTGRDALVVWIAVVTAGLVWGRLAIMNDPGHALRAAPLAGRWTWHASWALAPAVAFGALVAVVGPSVAARVRWRLVPVLAASVASMWAVLLSISDGWSRLSAPLRTRHEYVPFASGLDDPAEFVRSFTDHLPAYPVHVRGHPPGATLVFWGMDRIGLSGAGWAAVLVVIAWAVAVGAVVVCVAELAGRAAARRAAPFVALVPAAVWAGTSVDAMFAGVAALGVALIVVSCGRGGGTAVAVAIAGGAVLALALHLSYGVAPLLAVPSAVVVWRHRLDVVLSALAGGAAVTALWVGAGFWWFDGLAATRDAYWSGVAATRSWPYHLIVGNPAALALAAGPAIAVAAGWARRAPLAIWLVAAVTFGALGVADASGLSKGEVERIWLPYVPWLASVAAALPVRRQQVWLLAQVGLAGVLQAVLRSPW